MLSPVGSEKNWHHYDFSNINFKNHYCLLLSVFIYTFKGE